MAHPPARIAATTEFRWADLRQLLARCGGGTGLPDEAGSASRTPTSSSTVTRSVAPSRRNLPRATHRAPSSSSHRSVRRGQWQLALGCRASRGSGASYAHPFRHAARVRSLRAPVWVSPAIATSSCRGWAARCSPPPSKGELLVVRGAGHNDVPEVGGGAYWSWLVRAVDSGESPSASATLGVAAEGVGTLMDSPSAYFHDSRQLVESGSCGSARHRR